MSTLAETPPTDTALITGASAGIGAARPKPDRLLVGDVTAVAAEGHAACLRGNLIVVPGWVNRAATVGGRVLPKWLLRRISGIVSRRLKQLAVGHTRCRTSASRAVWRGRRALTLANSPWPMVWTLYLTGLVAAAQLGKLSALAPWVAA